MFSMYILSLMHSITMWICFLRYNTLHERIYKSSFTLQLVANGADGGNYVYKNELLQGFRYA